MIHEPDLRTDGPSLQPPILHQARSVAGGTASILGLTNLVIRHARLIGYVAIVFGILEFTYASFQPEMYTSSLSMILQANRASAGAMPGIAAQLGISLPAADPSQSPSFYAEIIRSRSILAALVDTSFIVTLPGEAPRRVSIADAYKVRRSPTGTRRDRTIERFEKVVEVRVSQKSGIITYSIAAPRPDLAQTLVVALLDELTRFNIQRRQSQASAERKFTERRLAEVGADLRLREAELEAFLRENRSMSNSPQLTFQNQRLNREVELRRTLYSNLATAYEQAKIEEVRDTPQITVLEPAEVPVRPDSRLRLGKTLVATVFGALLALFIAFTQERLKSIDEDFDEEAAEFRNLVRGLIRGMRHPFRRVRPNDEKSPV